MLPSPDSAGVVAAAAPAGESAAPYKSFRTTPPRPLPPTSAAVAAAAGRVLRLNDVSLLRTCLGIGAAMLIILAGTLLGGPSFALLSLAPIALIIIAAAARTPWTAILMYIGYASMEGMYKYLSDFSTVVYVLAPLLVAAIAVGWGVSRRARNTLGDPPPMAATVTMFSFIALIQCFNPNGGGALSGLATAFLWYVGPLLMYLVACNVVRSTRQVMALIYAFVIIGTVVSAFGLLQFQMGREWTFAHLPGYESTLDLGYEGGGFRPASTTAMGGGGAPWAHFAITSGLVLLLSPTVPLGRKVWVCATIAVNAVSLLLAATRVFVVIDVLTVLIFLVLNARSPRELGRSLAGIAAVGMLILIAAGVAQGLTGGKILDRYSETLTNPVGRFQKERGKNMVAFYALARDYPLGIGYQRGLGKAGTGGGQGIQVNRETQFACYQADLGMPGLITAFLLVGNTVYAGWLAFRRVRLPHLRPFAVMLFSVTLTYLLGCFAGPSLQGAVNFWVIAGVLVTLPRVEREERALVADARAQAAEERKRRSGGDGQP